MRLLSVILAVLLLAPSPGEADDILFIGNSFTFGQGPRGLPKSGGVPKLFETIANTKGREVKTSALTGPGWDWSFHLARHETERALASKVWNWVVLQDASTRPTQVGNVQKFLQDGEIFSQRIASNSPHAGILLYETWARPPGAFYQSSPGRAFSGPGQMMAELHQSYGNLCRRLAAENKDRPVRVAPVGTAFARCQKEYPGIELNAADHHHATADGYYLAALVIYETLYHDSAKNAVTSFFQGELVIPAADAAKLQTVAEEVSDL